MKYLSTYSSLEMYLKRLYQVLQVWIEIIVPLSLFRVNLKLLHFVLNFNCSQFNTKYVV